MIIKLSQLLFKRNPRKTTPPSDCVALRYDKVTDSMKIVKPNGAETPISDGGVTTASVLAALNGADATVSTVNKVTITAPATGATLTIADGQTLTVTTGGALGAAAFVGKSIGGYGATDGGKSAIFDGAGRLKAASLVILNAEDVESVLINSGNLVDRDYQLPDANGTLPVVPDYADLDAANTALAAGEFFWDTTLKKLRTATA